jgi:hypothetical protein
MMLMLWGEHGGSLIKIWIGIPARIANYATVDAVCNLREGSANRLELA